MTPTVVDFETEAIDDAHPELPPAPVGVAIREPGRQARYLAWGHPAENNCTKGQAVALLADVWRSGRPLLFHNAGFDLSVAQHHLGLRWPEPEWIEDTMPLLWLANPYLPLALKPAAERFCDVRPEEQDLLRDWILANVPEMKRKKRGWGRYIARAPGDLVGRYAKADVTMTLGLWKKLRPIRESMSLAYRREIRILEVAWRMTRTGIPIDVAGLTRFATKAIGARDTLEGELRRKLGDVDLAKGREVADALERKKLINPDNWVRTGKTRTRSVAADALRIADANEGFVVAWSQYKLLDHMLGTFVRPWLERQKDGRIYVRWNTVLSAPGDSAGGRKARGAKTGRLSSEPNVQNISKERPPGGLPSMRAFIRAPAGEALVDGDLSQQEPRLTAHFAGGAEASAYRADPYLDAHDATAELMHVDRTTGKTLNLAVTYALGLDALALRLGCTRSEASGLKAAWRRARPATAKLDQDLRRHWAQGGAIRTWGGAAVRVESPTMSHDGEPVRSYEYRALNTLIQRSAAEQLKECMIAADAAGLDLTLTAHDEILVLAPWNRRAKVRQQLTEILEETGDFEVPMVADVGMGKTWQQAKK